MQIKSGTALAYILFYWPFVLSGVATLLYFSKLPASRLFLLFSAGVLIGYGISMFLMMAVTSVIFTIAKTIELNISGQPVLIFHLAGSFILTMLLLWWLGKSLVSKV